MQAMEERCGANESAAMDFSEPSSNGRADGTFCSAGLRSAGFPLFLPNVIVHGKSSLAMGCLFGKPGSRDRKRLQSNQVYQPAPYTSAGPELSVLGDAELGQILNEIQLSPFPESRAEILQSRLGTRLITRSDLLQILKLIETDNERFARLSALFGNVSDPGGDWAPIHDLFEDASVRGQAVALTAPRARRVSSADS
jgi:hypothetical protein